MIRPHHLGENSSFLGQTCALCKQEFGVGDEIVICPEDGSRHHTHCWQANNNHCTAYGCRGEGVVGVATAAVAPAALRMKAANAAVPNPIARSSSRCCTATGSRRSLARRRAACLREDRIDRAKRHRPLAETRRASS